MSLLLTGTLVASVMLDHQREWKNWQKKFNALKLKKAQDELKAAEGRVDKSKLGTLRKSVEAANQNFAAKKKAFDEATQSAEKLANNLAKIKADYQNAKQYEDSYRYYLEEYRLHKDVRAKEYEQKLSEASLQAKELKQSVEKIEKDQEDAAKKIDALQEERQKAEKELAGLLEEKSRAEMKVQRIHPSLVKDVLNAPMIDFVAPTLQIQQIVLDNLQDDYHFAKVSKVDRCTTCHLGIDQKGFEDAPQPFRTHPNLDLYLGANSPHSIEKFGCTSCHGGSGQAVSFVETAHTPRDEKQKEEWEKKYQWHEMHHWDNKMLPLQHVEAACAKCHQGMTQIPHAPKLNEGRLLAETNGCVNCHKVKHIDNPWKVGPNLTRIQSKVGEEWISKWLDNPKDFRPATNMPRLFHLSNTSSDDDRARNNAAIHAISAYLMKNSESMPLKGPELGGDVTRGEKLVKTIGCLGCHSIQDKEAGTFAPALTGLGSKVTAEWLYEWVKNPSHFSPDTRMPSLRLSDQEASDITAYLLSQKNEVFDQKKLPSADMKVVDKMILESLQGTLRLSEAEAELRKMSGDEKMQYLGKRSINHQGCYACHQIKGFENANPVGTELSDEGRKDINKFDFGFAEIEKTRHDWIAQKLRNPRIFDHGRIRSYYEKLRMPQFDFTDKEIDSLTTFVLSLSEEKVPLEMRQVQGSEGQLIEKGKRLATKLNCYGCHNMDGREAVLRKITEDPGQAPPVLDGEGAKVHEKWLHGFLKSPTPIRTWLSYRMPTFSLKNDDLETLVSYFHHSARQTVRFGGEEDQPISEEALVAGKALFEAFQCIKCHQITQDSAALGTTFLAPDLTLTKSRLKKAWVQDWLRDPGALQPGTMMPTFFADGQSPMPEILGGDAEAQIAAIREYLYRYEAAPASDSKKT